MDSAQRLPDKVALVCGRQRVTYGELDAESNALAHALVRRGVERGDRVLIFDENSVHAVVAFWAALKANAVVCMVNPQTKAEKLSYMSNDSRSTALLTNEHLAPVVRVALARGSHLRAIIASGSVPEVVARDLPGLVGWQAAVSDGPRHRPPPRSSIDVD